MRSHNAPAADAYAGLNWFSGDAPVQEAVRTEAERNAPARRAEAQRETTGPPEGRAQAFAGYDAETGRGIYRSNFEENTPKAKKSERVIRLIQDVWSKNPIDLVVENEDGSKSIIKAEFDPDFDETSGRRSDASKLAGGNRHGTASEKRVTLNLADDFYRIIQESIYSGSKEETGKTSDTHAGVNMWRYFVNPILYMERSSNETTPYTVSIDVKQKDNGNFVYSFHAERDAKNNGQPAPQTLHAAVNGAENDTANGLPTDSIRSTSGNSQEKSSGRASTRVESRAETERKEAEAYRDAYASIYDFERMSVDEIERLLTEEIAADAYAGLNWFSGDAPVQEAVRAETERNALARRAEAQQETTGPPEGRGTIVVLPDGKKYVQADRQVIFGNDPDGWAGQIEGYINRKIRNGEDVILTTDSGDVLKITGGTAGKASFRNYVRDENGAMRRMTDAEYEAKLNAEAHIDELAQISERINKKPRTDETARNGQPIHGELARNGWIYRKAEFRDFDGQRYRVTISTADGNNGVVVYNVGKMQRRGSPAIKYGSSDSVTETGAQQGKSSSTVTIRQTEGDSQEKSSGKASVAGIRARTADRAALRRAEALEKSGTDNETIRQETGWYRGMDGQWRFEIDDSGAAFSRSGEAKYRADNADYARYTQLMNRMLTGELTEAEHAELLGLDKKNGSTKKELARRIDEGNATLRDILQHNALFEAYPEIAETKVKFADMPSGTAGSYNRETNTITIDAKLKYDANEALDVLMHEVQHRVQAAEGFTSGTNPGYWNRAETYEKAAEKYRDNRARLLNGLSAEDRALYNEYRSIDREMGAMFDGSVLYDESRMDALEKRSDELYKELYGKEWFGKLNRYDRILGDAGEAVKEFYRNTAGEIEARDTAARRRMSAEERKNTPPKLVDADTVFADGSNLSAYVDVDADGNPVTVVQTDKNVFDKANKSAYANIAKSSL